MATRKKNLSKAQTLNRTLADIYAPSDPDPSLFDIRNNVFENIRLSQEANAKSNFSKYESDTQKILSITPLNPLSDSKLYETNLSKLSNQIATHNFESSIPGIKSIPTSPEQVKIDRQNQITVRRNQLDKRARIDSETLGKIREKYGSWGEDIGDVVTSGYEDLGNTIYKKRAEEKLGIRNQFQERFEDPTGMKRLTRNVMASSNGDGGVLDKAYSSENSSEEFSKILRKNKKAFQKGVKDKSIRGYNSNHFSQYLDDNIGKIVEGSSAEAKKAFLDYAQTVKTARTNAEEQIENTKIKLDELKENGRKVNGKTNYLKMRQSFNAEELSELTKVSGAKGKQARFMDTLSKGINKLSFGHLNLNNNRVLNIQNKQIKKAYDKKLKGAEERLKNQQTLLQKINNYDDTAISSSQTAKGAHKAAGRYGLTGEQGERRAAENAAKKLKNLGWKGKVGAVVGLLALGGIIGNQFAGGHQTNSQLYNPSPQPQHYS